MAGNRALFVTGTDTGVGKTWVSAGLIRSLRSQGVNAVGFKPILCGEDRDDAEILLEASRSGPGAPPDLTLDEVNPVWLKVPVAPISVPLAGEAEPWSRGALIDAWESLAAGYDFVVIEGAGGWEVPLSPDETFADLAHEFGAPILVVAANRLGVLSHAKLTVDAITRSGLTCAGIVLNEVSPPDPNDPARRTNRDALRLMFPDLTVESLETGQAFTPVPNGGE